jgi:PKD repeat protein
MSLSAPTLALTAPASYTPAIAATQFPAVLPLSGLWTDPDGNLVEVKIMVRSSTETTDRLVADTIFTPTNSYPLASTVSFEKAGTYTVKLIARDSTNFVTETDLVVRVTGVATPACAPAQMFDCNGVELLDVSGAPTMIGHMVNGWNVAVRQIVPFGVLGISCSTPGATISFKTSGAVLQGGELITTTSTTQSMGKFTDTRYSSYDATAIQPVNIPITLSTNFFVQITCSAPGYVDSVTKFLIQNAK